MVKLASINYEIELYADEIKKILNWGLIVVGKDPGIMDQMLLNKLEVIAEQLIRDEKEEKEEEKENDDFTEP